MALKVSAKSTHTNTAAQYELCVEGRVIRTDIQRESYNDLD